MKTRNNMHIKQSSGIISTDSATVLVKANLVSTSNQNLADIKESSVKEDEPGKSVSSKHDQYLKNSQSNLRKKESKLAIKRVNVI